jgi:hypothetical protein
MPGASTTPDQKGARGDAPASPSALSAPASRTGAFRGPMASLRPYRRFGPALTDKPARLGFDAVRYTFIVVDFHHSLPVSRRI